jgi:hypothetical protein
VFFKLVLVAISPNLIDRCDERNRVWEKRHEHEYKNVRGALPAGVIAA